MIVVWRVTTQCNLNCGFCAYASSESIRRTSLESEQAIRFGQVLRDHQQRSGGSVLVSWLGGEPLLWPAIYDTSRLFRDEFGLRVGVTTNGTALCSDAAVQRAAECFDEITLSIDGLSATHDRLRGWPGGFDKLRDVVLRLLETQSPPWLRVNTVLMHDNVTEFAALCEMLARWGVDEVTFNQLGGNDRPDFHRTQRLTHADVKTLDDQLAALRDRLAQSHLRLGGGPRYLQRFYASAANVPLRIEDCAPADEFLFIDEHGMMAPCSFTTDDYAVPIDRIDSSDALRSLRSHYREQIAQRRSRWCLDCPSTRIFKKFADVTYAT